MVLASAMAPKFFTFNYGSILISLRKWKASRSWRFVSIILFFTSPFLYHNYLFTHKIQRRPSNCNRLVFVRVHSKPGRISWNLGDSPLSLPLSPFHQSSSLTSGNPLSRQHEESAITIEGNLFSTPPRTHPLHP